MRQKSFWHNPIYMSECQHITCFFVGTLYRVSADMCRYQAAYCFCYCVANCLQLRMQYKHLCKHQYQKRKRKQDMIYRLADSLYLCRLLTSAVCFAKSIEVKAECKNSYNRSDPNKCLLLKKVSKTKNDKT